jgi:hypothetical protein
MLAVVRFGKSALGAVVGTVRWFFDLLYGSIPAEFQSAFDSAESARRLLAVTRTFGVFAKQAVAAGDVSKEHVWLCKACPFLTLDFRGGLGPHFKGDFCEIDGRAKLSGMFTLGLFAKVFWTVWFCGLLVCIGLMTYASLLSGDPHPWWFPFAGLGMFSLGVAHVVVGKWFARDDIRWLSNVIEGALSDRHPMADGARHIEPHARIGEPSLPVLPSG